jgi:hypothetical protein
MRGIEVLVLRNVVRMLGVSFMRLGVPFIAPRQLEAVESNPRRQILPSVDWRTGQSGAPPDTVRCRYPSLFGEADCWSLRAIGAPDTVRCTPDSSVHQCDRWLATRHVRNPRPTVDSPDSPVHHQTDR